MAPTSQIKDKFEDYEGFVEKFKPKKTTDDCYTPDCVYNALLDWIDKNLISLEGKNILRPFWPGADYQSLDYKEGDIVIDNPPFSMISKICRWYAERGIKYFLFAPALTLFSSPLPGETRIVTHAEIIYHNGAVVSTSFRTNLLGGDPVVMVRGDLYEVLKKSQQNRTSNRKRSIIYPDNVITGATLGRLAVRGINLSFSQKDLHFVRKLDCGLTLFGSGYLLSERAAAERAAAERAAAEKAAAEKAVFSTRELKIIQGLGNG